MTDLRSQVLDCVDARPGIDAEELADLLGQPHRVTSDLVAEMCADGTLAPYGGNDG